MNSEGCHRAVMGGENFMPCLYEFMQDQGDDFHPFRGFSRLVASEKSNSFA